MIRSTVRNAILSLSFVNICFLNIWGKVLIPYHAVGPIQPLLVATFFNFLLLSAGVFVTREVLLRRNYKRLLVCCNFLLLFSVALSTQAFFVTELRAFLSRVVILALPYLILSVLALLTIWMANKPESFTRMVTGLLLICSPFVVVTLLHLGREVVATRSVNHDQEFHRGPTGTSSISDPRVVWIIFDELDEGQLFTNRNKGTRLAEFDRLKMESCYSDHAYPPASYTEKSLPSLLTGRIIEKIEPGIDDLNVRFQGENKIIGFREQAGVFTDAKQMGLKTAAVGWFNPYCRLLVDQLSSCYWTADPADWLLDNRSDGIPKLMAEQLKRILTRVFQRITGTDPMIEMRAKKIRDLQSLLTRAQPLAADASYGVVFIHLPVPHPPSVFSRSSAKICNCGDLTYSDDLELADRILGDLRRTMQSNNMWDSTAVLVSSDHWWRSEYWRTLPSWSRQDGLLAPKISDHRIPFLAKLPGQHSSFEIKTEFNTVITRAMISEIVTGRVRTPQQLNDWIDRNSRIAELPNYDKLGQ